MDSVEVNHEEMRSWFLREMEMDIDSLSDGYKTHLKNWYEGGGRQGYEAAREEFARHEDETKRKEDETTRREDEAARREIFRQTIMFVPRYYREEGPVFRHSDFSPASNKT